MAKHIDGRRIAQLRNRAHLDQTELAGRLRRRGFGTTQTTVSRWEWGQQPRRYILSALADELGVTVGDLYSDEDDASVLLTDDVLAALRDVLDDITSGRRLLVAA